MLAALKDNPTQYLQDFPDIVSQITETQRVGLQKFVAFVGDHPGTFLAWLACNRPVIVVLCCLIVSSSSFSSSVDWFAYFAHYLLVLWLFFLESKNRPDVQKCA